MDNEQFDYVVDRYNQDLAYGGVTPPTESISSTKESFIEGTDPMDFLLGTHHHSVDFLRGFPLSI